MGCLSKKDAIINVRLDQEARMRLDEISSITGISASSLARAAINRLLDRTYDDDGNIVNLSAFDDSKDINPADGYFSLQVVARSFKALVPIIHQRMQSGEASHTMIGDCVYVKLGDIIKANG